MTLNEERARQMFAPRGQTSAAVLQQAVPVVANAELQHRLEGPADTGGAGMAHEQFVSVDGIPVQEEDAEEATPDLNAALPDEEFPEVALPAMHFCADDVTSGGMDELQAVRKVYSELQELRETLVAEAEEDAAPQRPASSRVRSLQNAVRTLASRQITERIVRGGVDAEIEERGGRAQLPCEAFAVHTSTKPLSMYKAPMWGMCFPTCFPYGDGVFGLPRQKPLTFQQCASMHLLREELCYNVTPAMMNEALEWFAPAACASEEGGGLRSRSAVGAARPGVHVPAVRCRMPSFSPPGAGALGARSRAALLLL